MKIIKKIERKINKVLINLINKKEKAYKDYGLDIYFSPPLKRFIFKGKRTRPILMVLSYLGYGGSECPNIYTCAASIELLHTFFLIHDDLIDRSSLRRNLPTVHRSLQKIIERRFGRNYIETGEGLAIILGDLIYNLAVSTLLKSSMNYNKQKLVMKRILEVVDYTLVGEALDVILSKRDISKVSKKDIFNCYELKTAKYTFELPLYLGALLASADNKELMKLSKYGSYLGRAFQIRDDILGTFGNRKIIGKLASSDFKEAKKTILVWKAYNKSSEDKKAFIKNKFAKKTIDSKDITKLKKIIKDSSALEFANQEIKNCLRKAKVLNKYLKMKDKYKEIINKFVLKILS